MIPAPLAKDLLNHKKWQNENKLVLQESYKHNLDLVFTRTDGNFYQNQLYLMPFQEF